MQARIAAFFDGRGNGKQAVQFMMMGRNDAPIYVMDGTLKSLIQEGIRFILEVHRRSSENFPIKIRDDIVPYKNKASIF